MAELFRKSDSIPFDYRPVLLIPTLATRNTLAETLNSLIPSIDLFYRIFISVNGLYSTHYDSALDHFCNLDKGRCNLFRTGKVLKAHDHAAFIARNTAKLLHPKQYIMILCDDDLLGSRENLMEYFSFIRRNNDFVVGMGNFATFQNRPESFQVPLQNLASDEGVHPSEFIARTRVKSRFSNVSSMIMPAKAFQDSLSFMNFFGSSGFFAEYIFATHRNTNLVYSPPSVTAYIREHPNQESRTLPYTAFVHDEIIYFLWVWLNQPHTRPFTPGHLKYGLSAQRFRGIIIERFYLFLKSNLPGLLDIYKSIKKRLLS